MTGRSEARREGGGAAWRRGQKGAEATGAYTWVLDVELLERALDRLGEPVILDAVGQRDADDEERQLDVPHDVRRLEEGDGEPGLETPAQWLGRCGHKARLQALPV